jgi:hypothetical protein
MNIITQVYSTCGITRDGIIIRFVFNKRKVKESGALIKKFDGWRRGEIGRSVFAELVVRQAIGDAHAEKDVLSENSADAVSKVKPRYDNHNLKPMSPGIMLGPKPLAKHDEQCFEQPQLLQYWHKTVSYLFEACLHSVDDPQFLKDAFNIMIERATSLPSRDHGVTSRFVMGMAKCIRSMSDIVAKDYGEYMIKNEDTISSAKTAAYHKDYASGFISKVTAVQVMHAFQQKAFAVDCEGVVEDLMSTIQEQVKSYQKNTKIIRNLLRKHLSMPLYYTITNGDPTKLPLTWSSKQRGNAHDNFIAFLGKRKNKTQKEEPSDDDLMDTGLVVQRRFYLHRGKRESIEKKPRVTQHQRKTLLSHNPVRHSVVEQLDPVG